MDAQLMRRAGKGEAQAYRQLADAYTKRVLNHAYRILGNVAEAEEVTQEAFVRLWKVAPKWDSRAKVTTWLFRVVHNLAVDRVRRRRPVVSDETELASDSARPSQMLARRRTAESVRDAVQQLPERQRHALQLSHYEGLGNAEIGEVLGVGVEAVESLLSRARRQLRQRLAEHERAE
jgi:RNA polymerase sigma-70 factor (ECF subfamily)